MKNTAENSEDAEDAEEDGVRFPRRNSFCRTHRVNASRFTTSASFALPCFRSLFRREDSPRAADSTEGARVESPRRSLGFRQGEREALKVRNPSRPWCRPVGAWRSQSPTPGLRPGLSTFGAVGAGSSDFRAVGAGSFDFRAVGAGSFDFRAVDPGAFDFRAVGAVKLELRRAGAFAVSIAVFILTRITNLTFV